jgi:hypothetical protein
MEHSARGENLRKSMIAKYGSEEAWRAHMHEIASKGGKNGRGTKRGFASGIDGKDRARIQGKVGGRISRRPSKNK